MPAWREHLPSADSYFGVQLDALQDEELHRPCLLPGWTRAHLVTHVSRNADALRNLLEWARTGVETPMYSSMDQRDGDIAAGATRSAVAIREDVREASQLLARAIDELPDQAWSGQVRTASGRTIAAGDVLWIRVREVWVHAVDLGAGGRFEDVPAEVGDALLDEALGLAGSKQGCPALRVLCRESGREWTLGDPTGTNRTVVEGSRPDLLSWALGRYEESGSDRGMAPAASNRPWPPSPGWL